MSRSCYMECGLFDGADFAVNSFQRPRISQTDTILDDMKFIMDSANPIYMNPCIRKCPPQLLMVLSVSDSEGNVGYHAQCSGCNVATPIVKDINEAITVWNKELSRAQK